MGTLDARALELLLAGDQAGLARLAAVASGRLECPDCGDCGPHDDNGRQGADLTYCCRKCGCHLDAYKEPDPD